MLAILDYKAGNQTSVQRALEFLGVPCLITADPAQILAASGVIFPGVGAAGQAMHVLDDSGLGATLKEVVALRKPLLGICLGCQILLDYSAENDTRTLGVIPGRCDKFSPDLSDEDGSPIRIPHMGWNSLNFKRDWPLFRGVDPQSEFYFVHSYYPEPAPEYVIATTSYGREFCSIHGRDGLWATQFHPEKSGRPGLAILANFQAYCQEAPNA